FPDSCWVFADLGSHSMALTCGRTKLEDIDEHLHAGLLVCVAEGFVTCVFPVQQGCGQLWILAILGGLLRLVAVLMLTAC
ncbi:hypothetical protein, partial [Streptomyces rubiginosohelvolus]|uniref:hypothetical protein n=1 Tax=Streptomyces rubiginosohelvolus TaxID=67362 RepID=UPI00369031D8